MGEAIIALLFVLLGVEAYRIRRAEVLHAREMKVMEGIRKLHTARLAEIRQSRTTRRNPQVDAAARTTVRDTQDLPRTGRMGRVVTHRSSPPPDQE